MMPTDPGAILFYVAVPTAMIIGALIAYTTTPPEIRNRPRLCRMATPEPPPFLDYSTGDQVVTIYDDNGNPVLRFDNGPP